MVQTEFDKYVVSRMEFSGRMDFMANSIDVVISNILENLGCNLRKIKMLGDKIKLFKKNRTELLTKYSGNFDDLVERLYGFNKKWVHIKHGMFFGSNINTLPTFRKDDINYSFDPKIIDAEFVEIMADITEINNRVLSGC